MILKENLGFSDHGAAGVEGESVLEIQEISPRNPYKKTVSDQGAAGVNWRQQPVCSATETLCCCIVHAQTFHIAFRLSDIIHILSETVCGSIVF